MCPYAWLPFAVAPLVEFHHVRLMRPQCFMNECASLKLPHRFPTYNHQISTHTHSAAGAGGHGGHVRAQGRPAPGTFICINSLPVHTCETSRRIIHACLAVFVRSCVRLSLRAMGVVGLHPMRPSRYPTPNQTPQQIHRWSRSPTPPCCTSTPPPRPCSSSKTSTSGTTTRAPSFTTSASTFLAARQWRWWARAGAGSRRSSASCTGSMTCRYAGGNLWGVFLGGGAGLPWGRVDATTHLQLQSNEQTNANTPPKTTGGRRQDQRAGHPRRHAALPPPRPGGRAAVSSSCARACVCV